MPSSCKFPFVTQAVIWACVCCTMIGLSSSGFAQAGVTYPKVYGPTGSLYGPTRAFEAYRSQYGRDWVPHSRGNFSGSAQRSTRSPRQQSRFPNYYGYNTPYPQWGYRGYAPGYSPLVIPYVPGMINPPVFTNPGFGTTYFPVAPAVPYYIPNQSLSRNGILQGAVPFLPQSAPAFSDNRLPQPSLTAEQEQLLQQHWKHQTAKPVVPSTITEQLTSQRHLTQGDAALRSGSFSRALSKYRHAAALAPDLPQPHQQLGYTFLLMGRFEEAGEEWKTTLQLDATWPKHAQKVTEAFDERWQSRAEVQFSRLVDWMKQDYENPERLWTFGICLFLFEKYDQAADVLNTLNQLPNRTVDPTPVLEAIARQSSPKAPAITNPLPSAVPPQFPEFNTPNSPKGIPSNSFLPPEPTPLPTTESKPPETKQGPLLFPPHSP